MEEWRPLPGYEGFYSASTLGRIRRECTGPGTFPGRIRETGRPSSSGYVLIHLSRNAQRRVVLLHRVIAETFFGPCPDGMEVNHIDGDKLNNAVGNLEYVTRKANHAHAINVLGHRRDGYFGGTAKLTIDQVRSIRQQYAAGNRNFSELGRRFGVRHATVSRIISGRTWRNVA